MDENFCIYVDQLREGKRQVIDEEFSPDFLDINEEFLSFKEKVSVKGEVYTAGDTLVMHLDIATKATMPCTVCNAQVDLPIEINGLYHTEPLDEIKKGIFRYGDVVREAILLDTPTFAECNEGNCSKRKELKKYLKQTQEGEHAEDRYHPFADL